MNWNGFGADVRWISPGAAKQSEAILEADHRPEFEPRDPRANRQSHPARAGGQRWVTRNEFVPRHPQRRRQRDEREIRLRAIDVAIDTFCAGAGVAGCDWPLSPPVVCAAAGMPTAVASSIAIALGISRGVPLRESHCSPRRARSSGG